MFIMQSVIFLINLCVLELDHLLCLMTYWGSQLLVWVTSKPQIDVRYNTRAVGNVPALCFTALADGTGY